MILKNNYFDDCYFSQESGFDESCYVFIEGNNLNLKDKKEIKIGETGFGTGLNLLVLEDFLKNEKDKKVTFTTVEKYFLKTETVKNALINLKGVSLEALEGHLNIYKFIDSRKSDGWNSFSFKRAWGVLEINLFIGDVMDSFENYPVKNICWFLDGHSPEKNPDMWSREVLSNVARNSDEGATFATFTAAGMVKKNLRDSGFFVKRKKGYGKKRHMIFGFLLFFL